jgi:tRNA U34 2-thiouridine synthase MnmA/TrmU
VTPGQRRGLGSVPAGGQHLAPTGRRYVIDVDVERKQVLVGDLLHAQVRQVAIGKPTWTAEPASPGAKVMAQVSAHGPPVGAIYQEGSVEFEQPRPPVAPGQTLAFYDRGAHDFVLGAAVAERRAS